MLVRLGRYMQASVQGAASLSQVLTYRLMAGWGEAGLAQHLRDLQASYARRCTALLSAARRHLGSSGEEGWGESGGGADGMAVQGGAGEEEPLATWNAPGAGMFLWMRLGCGVVDSEALQPFLKAFKVAVVPGVHFHVQAEAGPFVRLSYASASEEDFDSGMERLAQLLRRCRDEGPLKQ